MKPPARLSSRLGGTVCSRPTPAVGRIAFLVGEGLGSLIPCCLSAGGRPQLLQVARLPCHVAPSALKPAHPYCAWNLEVLFLNQPENTLPLKAHAARSSTSGQSPCPQASCPSRQCLDGHGLKTRERRVYARVGSPGAHPGFCPLHPPTSRGGVRPTLASVGRTKYLAHTQRVLSGDLHAKS